MALNPLLSLSWCKSLAAHGADHLIETDSADLGSLNDSDILPAQGIQRSKRHHSLTTISLASRMSRSFYEQFPPA
jgi:hypothetical protein